MISVRIVSRFVLIAAALCTCPAAQTPQTVQPSPLDSLQPAPRSDRFAGAVDPKKPLGIAFDAFETAWRPAAENPTQRQISGEMANAAH